MASATPSSVPQPSASRPRTRLGSPAPDLLAHSLVGEYLTEQKEERAAAARRNRRSRPWRRIASLAAIMACGAVWLMPSLGEQPAPTISAGRMDASARLTLFLASQRVRAFEQRYERLPTTAQQSGIVDTRIEYRLTGPHTFTLSMSQDGRRWELPSTAADTAYMRAALAQLGRSR